MHLLVMGLGSSFRDFSIQFSLSDLQPGYYASKKNYGKTVLNEEVPVHEWQQKVKHVEHEGVTFSVRCCVFFIRLKKPREQL